MGVSECYCCVVLEMLRRAHWVLRGQRRICSTWTLAKCRGGGPLTSSDLSRGMTEGLLRPQRERRKQRIRFENQVTILGCSTWMSRELAIDRGSSLFFHRIGRKFAVVGGPKMGISGPLYLCGAGCSGPCLNFLLQDFGCLRCVSLYGRVLCTQLLAVEKRKSVVL